MNFYSFVILSPIFIPTPELLEQHSLLAVLVQKVLIVSVGVWFPFYYAEKANHEMVLDRKFPITKARRQIVYFSINCWSLQPRTSRKVIRKVCSLILCCQKVLSWLGPTELERYGCTAYGLLVSDSKMTNEVNQINEYERCR